MLVDIFYDHLLARDWVAVHHLALHEYCAGVYRMIEARMADLPEHAHGALRLMAREDWLSSYAEIAGIADVLLRMSRRARQPNSLAQGEVEFLADAGGFEADFREWLADITVFCAEWREGKGV